jgi:hypothetical protein
VRRDGFRLGGSSSEIDCEKNFEILYEKTTSAIGISELWRAEL